MAGVVIIFSVLLGYIFFTPNSNKGVFRPDIIPPKLDSVSTATTSTVKPTITPTPSPKDGRQAYVLVKVTDPKISLLLDNPEIDGISLQAGWMDMEKGNNKFDWKTLDEALKIAKEKKKGVTIRPLSVFRSGDPMLDWLKTQGMQTTVGTNEIGVTSELALPWDEVFLSEYIEFLNALSSHISQSGYADTVENIQLSAPMNEMNIPTCRNGLIGEVPYDRTKYLSAWKRVIDAFEVAFPNTTKFISATGGNICRPQVDKTFFPDVMNYAIDEYGNDFIPSANDLMTRGSGRMSSYLDLDISKNGLAYQMIWFSTNATNNRLEGAYPNNLLESVCKGIDDGASYIEIYAVDVLNSDSTIKKAIRAIHDDSLCES